MTIIPREKSNIEKKPKRVCPKCGSENVIPIVYGLFAEPLPYEVIYGGCAVTNDSREWHCSDCGNEWGRIKF